MFGVGYFASNVDEYFMVLNNPNFSVGIIDDNPEKYKVRNQFGLSVMPRKDVVMLSSLLPPPEAISAFIDGDPTEGANIYYNFLNSDTTVQNIISVLLKLFFIGRNIVLFVPRDESTSIRFIPVLADYLLDIFGIRIGDIRNPNSAISNPSMMQFANIIKCLYLYNNLSFLDFCMNYPIDIPINEVVSKKVISDNNINIFTISNWANTNEPTMADVVAYANAYVKGIRDNTNRGIAETNKQFRQVISRSNKDSDNK